MNTKEDQYIVHLRQNVESYVGRKLKTPKDFRFLSETIFHRTHLMVSSTTLKRIWGYLDEHIRARVSTLDILSVFVGYANWSDFCTNHSEFLAEMQEGFFTGNSLTPHDLRVGQKLQITWMPSSQLCLRYIGGDRFRVIEAQNSSLKEETMIRLHSIVEGHQLCLFPMDRVTAEDRIYFCGRVGGVQFELI